MQINFIPFEHIHNTLKTEFIETFKTFLDDKRYILGKHVQTFENSWAAYCGCKYGIGVGNGYDAIMLCLSALEIGNKDEVIVPAHTFAASVLPIINCGAKPVLVDADPLNFNISTQKIEDKINANTKAILAVHLYGNPCEMEKLVRISNKHNLHLIEDNAQSHGATYNNEKTGSFGVLSATSFYPIKNLGALGDAGAITTNDPLLKEKIALLRTYGSPDKHEFKYAGVNSRLDELQAAFLNIKLKHLNEWNDERRQIAKWYNNELRHIEELQLLTPTTNSQPVYHIYPILASKRNALQKHLLDHGVQTLTHYPNPYHLEKAFAHLRYKKGDFPVTERLCEHEISLPLFPGLKENEVAYVCDTIRKFYQKK